jgi:heme/copper-type cytochrome/quinol oxidase subunit 2
MTAARLAEIFGGVQGSLLWICTVVAAMVFAALVYSTVTFRPTVVSTSGQDWKVTRELAWALVPILIVIAAAAPAMKNVAPAQSGPFGLASDSHVTPCASALADSAPPRILRTASAAPCSHR